MDQPQHELPRHAEFVVCDYTIDEGFFFRDGGKEKRYLYRAIDERGQVLDVLYRDLRDPASAEAFFRRTVATSGVTPTTVVSDHHQPYLKAVQEVFPMARHVRTGLHRAKGETTKGLERSHIPTRDRLRSSRSLKTLATGQRCFEGFEAVQALGHDQVHLERLVPGSRSLGPRLGPERGRWPRPSPCWGRDSAGPPDDGQRPEPPACSLLGAPPKAAPSRSPPTTTDKVADSLAPGPDEAHVP